MGNPLDLLGGLDDAAAYKVPCKVATLVDMTNTMTGLPIIDGYQVLSGDRVLVRANADLTTNGIYVAASGGWSRAVDFTNSSSVYNGTQVLVIGGKTYAGFMFSCQQDYPTIGVTAITFSIVTMPPSASNDLWLKANFSAIGNGTADDTAAVNAWVAAGKATGARMCAEPGHYKITGAGWTIDLAGVNSVGLTIDGAGTGLTIFDVSACTGISTGGTVTQFLVADSNGAVVSGVGTSSTFYFAMRGIAIRGNIAGRVATICPDAPGGVGYVFPSAGNGYILDLLIANNSTAAGAVGIRLNYICASIFRIQSNGPGPTQTNVGTVAIEFGGVNFSTGQLYPGGFDIGVKYTNGYSYGNLFSGCDFEVLQTPIYVDVSAYGGGDLFSGTFVWGAWTANPIHTGQDGTTPFAVMNSIHVSYVNSFVANLSSNQSPTVVGTYPAKMVFQTQGLHRFLLRANEYLAVIAADGNAGITMRTGGPGGPNAATVSFDGTTMYLSNYSANANPKIQLNAPLAFVDGSTKQSGDQKFQIAQPSMFATGGSWTNANHFPVTFLIFNATSVVVNLYDTANGGGTAGGFIAWNPQIDNEQVMVPVPPGWTIGATYTGTGAACRVIPA